MATYSNLFIDQGSDFDATIDLSQTTGSLNLTGFSAAGSIAKSYDGTSKGSFTASVDDTNNELDISLTAAETAALKPGRYVYDVIIKSPAGVITRVLEGQLEVTPGVTFDAATPETTLGAGNISSSESSGSSSSSASKSIFTKTLPASSNNDDAYAFIQLDQNLRYDSTTNSSITLSLTFNETQNAASGRAVLFLTTQTFVNSPYRWDSDVDGYFSNSGTAGLDEGPNTVTLSINSVHESEGTVQYLGIVYEDTSNDATEREVKFEIKDLEITSSTHPDGVNIGFTGGVLNGNTVDSSNAFKFDSISSSTGLFKSWVLTQK